MNILLNHNYQIGGSLPVDATTYVQRQADQEIYTALKSGEFCYVLSSRQMGKSSLRVQVMHRLREEGFACVGIDLTAIGTTGVTQEQWYFGMINSIVRQLHLQKQFDVYNWWLGQNLLSGVQKLSIFIEEVLLELVSQNIAIFLDEIDSVLSLPFRSDDFFALIRDFYNRRADNATYNRLTFTLLGAATPTDLIKDPQRTPFNIGHSINLTGFKLWETASLGHGLAERFDSPQALLKAVLNWTGGQPLLTQKLCYLLLMIEEKPLVGYESEWVKQVVHKFIINNWEVQDDPPHLRTIRDRILRGDQKTSRLLGLYQQILHNYEEIAYNDTDRIDLLLTGLVERQNDRLQIYNRIYQAVFNQDWLNQSLAKLRPYASAITEWLESGQMDDSRLLKGQALNDAQIWAKGKSLGDADRLFLDASQELEKRHLQQLLRTEVQANIVFVAANKKANRRLKTANLISIIMSFGMILVGGFSIKIIMEIEPAPTSVTAPSFPPGQETKDFRP
jgi:AAA-like domain